MLLEIKKIKSHIILILIMIGIFLPSSINRDTLGILYPVLNALLAMTVLLLSIKKINFIRSILVLFILLLLIVNTTYTNLLQFQFGTLLVILPILFYLSSETIAINTKLLIKYLNFSSIILLILGMGVILDIAIVKNFLSSSYVTTFTDLYKYMMAANRPVGPFGSHSIAAFMYFIFFMLNYTLWIRSKHFWYLIVSIAYLILILSLKSFSAIFFIIFALGTMLNSKFLLKKININFIVINILSIITVFLLLNSFIDVIGLLSGTETNGLLSRYGSNGILNINIQYLQDYLYLGDGIGYDAELTYTDSGYIHNLLIYGISGTIAFYMAFSMKFFQRNLTYIFILFISFLFFEIGYDIFFYTRAIYILLLITFFAQMEKR